VPDVAADVLVDHSFIIDRVGSSFLTLSSSQPKWDFDLEAGIHGDSGGSRIHHRLGCLLGDF
jgi:hypothetical protein